MSVLKMTALIPLLVVAGAAQAAPVRHAGEWETTIDGGRTIVVCLPHDETFDASTLTRAMSRTPEAKCATSNFSVEGSVMKVTIACDYRGLHMVTDGVTTATGPDSYVSRSHIHTEGAMKMPNGQSMAMPDQTMTTTSRRIGPCKPGDRVVEH